MMSLLLALLLLPASTVDGDALLRRTIPAALEWYADRSEDPLPQLSARQLDELLEGKVVKIRRRLAREGEGEPHERVVGYRLAAVERPLLWLSALDPHFLGSDLLTEHRLRRDEDGASVWYQHLRLPWPLSDRHWVIRVDRRIDLAAATEGHIWEQRWELEPRGEDIAAELLREGRVPGLDPDAADSAVYLPANHGSWILFALDEATSLLAYRVTVDPGGRIPEGWIATFAMARLDELLEGVVGRAPSLRAHYVEGHDPLPGGDGRPLPPYAP